MTQINPFMGSILQSPVVQRQQSAEKDRQVRRANDMEKNAALPEDFLAELEKNPEAKVFFETLNSINRYAIYYRLLSAKKPETRRARIANFVTMLAEHRKFY